MAEVGMYCCHRSVMTRRCYSYISSRPHASATVALSSLAAGSSRCRILVVRHSAMMGCGKPPRQAAQAPLLAVEDPMLRWRFPVKVVRPMRQKRVLLGVPSEPVREGVDVASVPFQRA